MSIFNRSYRSDEQLAADHEDDLRKTSIKRREMKNRLAQDIFIKVIEQIESGACIFTKEEMIALARGIHKYANDGERYVWHNACTMAIQRIRRYHWSDIKDTTNRRMFNYVRGKYKLIDITNELDSNMVYTDYDQKMKGIAMKQAQLASSAYQKVLELDVDARQELIKRLKEAEAID